MDPVVPQRSQFIATSDPRSPAFRMPYLIGESVLVALVGAWEGKDADGMSAKTLHGLPSAKSRRPGPLKIESAEVAGYVHHFTDEK